MTSIDKYFRMNQTPMKLKVKVNQPDPITGIGKLEKTIPKVEQALSEGMGVGLLYLDVSRFWAIEDLHGPEVVDRLFGITVRGILDLKSKFSPGVQVLPSCRLWRDDFIIFLIPKKKIKWTEELLSDMANTVHENLSKRFSDYSEIDHGNPLEFFLGWSSIIPSKRFVLSNLITRGIREALDFAAEQRFSDVPRKTSDLKRILDKGLLKTVFQPVIHLKTGAILGYEALARGPEGSPFNHPELIFNLASKGKFLLQAERTAKISAMEAARGIPKNYKLFLNIDSELLVRPEEILKMLREIGCLPGRVVFEITERKAVKDFEQLQKIVKMMKEEGYFFAIDDAGSGYASMESIAILDPHYIKIDQSIVRGIHLNSVKQDVVKAFINLSKMRNATIIAEGVEEREEAEALIKLGIEYAQGFYFARPSFPPASEKVITKMGEI